MIGTPGKYGGGGDGDCTDWPAPDSRAPASRVRKSSCRNLTATGRARPFWKLLRVREADERAIVELSDTRKL
eukprot:scaffold37624_cov62-Phaeocystis_antarctica.AAC.3